VVPIQITGSDADTAEVNSAGYRTKPALLSGSASHPRAKLTRMDRNQGAGPKGIQAVCDMWAPR
jgi:hypothetical protein